jgi:glutamate dehydrogenase
VTDAQNWADELIDEATVRVRERFGADEAPAAEELLRRYYSHVAWRDLDGRTPSDLYGAAISHIQLARYRPPGQALIRIYSPTVEDDGWRSAHTVIDLVADDSPFIVASVLIAIEDAGLEVHRLVHPVLSVRRDGDLLIGPAGDGSGRDMFEAFVHIEVDRVLETRRLRELERAIETALTAVRQAVSDWRPMTERAERLAAELEARSSTGSDQEADAAELLRWMASEEFVFLGARDYRLDPSEGVIRSIPDSGLGILRDHHRRNDPCPTSLLKVSLVC